MNYLSLVWITASTVGKVVLCCAVGMFISRYFSHPENSEKGFTYICVRILFPLLLFSSLCLSLTWESLRLYYWAPIIACMPIILGISGACLCRFYLNSTYAGMLILGCTFQNGLTYPVSLIMNLKGIPWFGSKELDVALEHIFLYNIICSIGLWAIGEPVIKHFKALEVAEEKAVQEELRRQRLAALSEKAQESQTKGIVFPFSHIEESSDDGHTGHEKEDSPLASTFQQFAWYRPADPLDTPINPMSIEPPGLHGSTVEAKPADPGALSPAGVCSMLATALRAAQSPMVAACLLAMIVALVPPLRWVAESMPGEIVISGFALIGSGAIPLQLLVLGASVVGKRSTDPEEDGEAPATSWIEKLKSQQSLFIISSIVIRLIIVPTICFGLIHVLSTHRIIPNDRVFLLAMLIGTCCPSAINSSIICVMHEYHAREYSQMIFIMYISAIFLSTVWLFIYILYLNQVAA